jgi:hypothetical protein
MARSCLAAYFLANVRISSGYLLPAFFSTPIILLVVGQAEITVAVLRRLWFCVVAIWLPLLIASPAFGWYTASRWQESAVAPTREIAIEATRLWREAFGTPLRFVAGDMPLATAATFYSPDTPSYMILENPAHSPWVSVEESRKAGVLILCRAYETKCISGAERFVGAESSPHMRELVLNPFGQQGSPQRFILILDPPHTGLPSN